MREILEHSGVRFALIGAAAVALRGLPRFTQDTDLLTTDRRVLDPAFWGELTRRGTVVDIRKGDFDDPLAGVVRIGKLPDQVDLIVGRRKWEEAVVERAEYLDAFEGSMPVATRSDLILLKLAAGGYKDLVDAAGLLRLGPTDELIAEVNAHIQPLAADAQEEWARLVRAI